MFLGMSAPDPPCPAMPPPSRPTAVQPGGAGAFVRMEMLWGRLRRSYLRRIRQGHVKRWTALRKGDCTNCDHDIIDPRDLKYVRNVCGFWFHRDDDVYAHRENLGFARYGYAELVGFSSILTVFASTAVCLVIWGSAWFIPVFVLILVTWLEVVWFFRDPARQIPGDSRALVSPADGAVTHAGIVNDPDFPGGRAFRVSIFLSIFDVHVNRVPRPGSVKDLRYFRGEFLDARNAQCPTRNEQLWVDFEESGTGQLVRVKQIAGAIARRIVCWLRKDELVQAGDRFGMIKFGSRTDVLISADRIAEVSVKVGDRVQGGSTFLARCK